MANPIIRLTKEKKMIAGCCLFCLIAAVISLTKEKEKKITEITRNESSLIQNEKLIAQIGEKEYPFELEVKAKELTQKEKLELLEQAIEEIEIQEIFLGKNPNTKEISRQLNFPEFLVNDSVSCQWTTQPEGWIDSNGTILYPKENTQLFEKQKVILIVQLECGQVKTTIQKEVTIIPFVALGKKEVQEQLQQIYTNNELEHQTDKEINLPESFQGKAIHWIRKPIKKSRYFVVLGILASIAIWIAQKKKTKNEIQLRGERYQKQLPCFIQEMAVFLGTGMSVKKSFEKVSQAMLRQKEQQFLGKEIQEMLDRIKEGENELKAYQDFGERAAVPEYRRFMALIIQNIRKGTYQMSEMLNLMAREAYGEQLRQVRIQGEKVSARLLVPMVVLLCLVLVMVITPAIFTNYR